VGIPMSAGELQTDHPDKPDLLGQMSHDEAGKFRNSWCMKRYDHDHDLCGFAHVDVNGGWLRRNPSIHAYKDEMCIHVSKASDKQISPTPFFLNECPNGIHCENAHSLEEIIYHPNRYKSKMCGSLHPKSAGCQLGDVCPNLHPPDSARPLKKQTEGRSQGLRHQRKGDQSLGGLKNASVKPPGAPVIYATPAPFSSFERQLAMPGLQALYRRHSSVVRAHVRTSGKCQCSYSCFGDDLGISRGLKPSTLTGLPSVRKP